jgi:hypothetical protein
MYAMHVYTNYYSIRSSPCLFSYHFCHFYHILLCTLLVCGGTGFPVLSSFLVPPFIPSAVCLPSDFYVYCTV